MSDKIDRVLDVVSGLADAMQHVLRGQDTLREGQDKLRDDVSNLAEGQDKLRGDVMARLDRLQDSQLRVRDEVAVNYAADEQIGRRLDNSDEQTRLLREQVNLLNRMLRQMNERLEALEEDRDQSPNPSRRM